ncbi:MAG TPA: PKD domain-containing protein [Methanoregulaceae archaeon]|nr:PKD domain-containing protein [Methanoregulaceae archaeon]
MTRQPVPLDIVLVGEAGSTYQTAIQTVMAHAADICQGIWSTGYYATPIEGLNYQIDHLGAARPLINLYICVVADPSGALSFGAAAYPLLVHGIAFRYSPALSVDENAAILSHAILESFQFRGWCDNPNWYHASTGLLTWARRVLPSSELATNPTNWDTGSLANRLIWYRYLSEQVRDILPLSSAPKTVPYEIVYSPWIAPWVASQLGDTLWTLMAERTHFQGEPRSNTWLAIDRISAMHDHANCFVHGSDWNGASSGLLPPLHSHAISLCYRDEIESSGTTTSSTGPWPGGPTGSVAVVLDIGMSYDDAARRIWRALLDMQYLAGKCEDPSTRETSAHFDAWLRINFPGESFEDAARELKWYQYLNDQVWFGFTPSTQPPPYIDPVVTGTTLTAEFSANPRSGTPPLSVTLVPDLAPIPAVGYIEWRISAQGQYEQVSYDIQPTFVLTEPGRYDVSVWIRTTDNVQYARTKLLHVTVSNPPPEPQPGYAAHFTATLWSGDAPLTITFSDASTVPGGVQTSLWSFSDGSPIESGLQVTHTFVAPGTYSVTHFVVDGAGYPYSVTYDVEAYLSSGGQSPWYCAAFVARPRSGPAPLTVTLIDTSIVPGGVQQGRWWFGDGTEMSTAPTNEVHTYETAGQYVVVHWVCGTDGVGYVASQTIVVGGTAVVPGTDPEEPDPPEVVTEVAKFKVGDRVLWIPPLNVIVPLM